MLRADAKRNQLPLLHSIASSRVRSPTNLPCCHSTYQSPARNTYGVGDWLRTANDCFQAKGHAPACKASSGSVSRFGFGGLSPWRAPLRDRGPRDGRHAGVLSQVVLSLILPVPMIALLVLTRSRDVMGPYANGHLTMVAAVAAAIVVLALNLLLVLQIAVVPLAGL